MAAAASALYYAICSGHGDVARRLLQNGARVDMPQRDLLSGALDHGLVELAEEMLENGADVSRGAFHADSEAGYLPIVQRLLTKV